MAWCLIPRLAETFKQDILSGKIKPDELSKMTSQERQDFFATEFGVDNAKEINALFESKLILKDQQAGMVNWAKQLMGLKPDVKRDILSRIEKMDKILNPTEQKLFLEDLAAKRLGTDVTFEEAKKITEMSSQMVADREKVTNTPDGSPERIQYGASKVALQDYVNELKLSNDKVNLSHYLNPLNVIKKIASISKGIKASLDNSAIFRQGWKTLFTNPKIWAENASRSFVDIAKQLGKSASNNDILNGIKAEIYSRENALNGLQQKAKLDIGEFEEAFPTTLPEKIPLFGRLYKASEVAYTGFLYRMRADIFDRYVDIAKKNEVDLSSTEQVRSIGQLVNSLTGRGNLGPLEKIGKQVNTIFFSPKMFKSQVDFLTQPLGFDIGGTKVTPFTRKIAAINLLKVITGTATIMAVANAIKPGSAELDPRSSDFGKIRVGDTRFDISGGMSSVITLAARLLSSSTKSSTTGKVNQINSGDFGSQTGSDVFWNFFENKLSPIASVVKDLANRRDFNGNPITVQGELSNLLTPLPITNANELLTNKNAANPLIALIADGLGISTNTYSPKQKKPSGFLTPGKSNFLKTKKKTFLK